MPLFRSFRNAVAALGAYLGYHRFLASYVSPLIAIPPQAPLRLPQRRGVLNEIDSKAILASAGIPITVQRLCRAPEEAVSAARAMGGPVAMKISSADIPHKSEGGLLRLNVSGDDAVASTFADLLNRARRAHPGAAVDGVLVQEMVTGGVEVLVGMSRDPVLGPTVAFGLGGVFVEVLHDVALRTVPLAAGDAAAMIREIRGFPLLNGARGRAPADWRPSPT